MRQKEFESQYLQQPSPYKIGEIIILKNSGGNNRWEIVEFKDKDGILIRRPNFYKNKSMQAFPYEFKTVSSGRIERI